MNKTRIAVMINWNNQFRKDEWIRLNKKFSGFLNYNNMNSWLNRGRHNNEFLLYFNESLDKITGWDPIDFKDNDRIINLVDFIDKTFNDIFNIDKLKETNPEYFL